MFEDRLQAFLEMMQAERGAGVNTLSAYRRDLELLGEFFKSRGIQVLDASSHDLADFLSFLSNSGDSARTQARRLSAVREFYRFAFSENWIVENPTDMLMSPKLPHTLPKYLSESEVQHLLLQAQQSNLRLYTMLEVLYASGMRVSELVGLPVSAFVSHEKQLFVVGKGGRERTVPLNDYAYQALNHWVDMCQIQQLTRRPSKWLFPSKGKTGHITRDAFFKELKRLAISIGLNPDRVSPHVFRHSFASHLVAHDADLRSVQQLLGHADIRTTEIYTHILPDRLKKIVEKSHPLSYNSPTKENK